MSLRIVEASGSYTYDDGGKERVNLAESTNILGQRDREIYVRINENLSCVNAILINTIEKDGILAMDDTLVEKTGKNIEAAGWIFDHSIGKTVRGIRMTTSVLSV